jgi:hypothetical protein
VGKNKSRNKSGKKRSRGVSRQKKVKPTHSKKFLFIIIVLIIFGVGGYFIYDKYTQAKIPNMKEKASTKETSAKIKGLSGGETRPTLRPSRFKGKVARAYAIAQEEPKLLDTIYCYCYCKRNLGHKSLLTCFVDTHAAQCDICMNQAFYASSLHVKEPDYSRVREAVDRKFWKPFS